MIGNALWWILNSLFFVRSYINKKIIIGINENIKEPILPDIVLLGLILVNFLPPIVLPITYPPISEKMQINKIKIITYKCLYIS